MAAGAGAGFPPGVPAPTACWEFDGEIGAGPAPFPAQKGGGIPPPAACVRIRCGWAARPPPGEGSTAGAGSPGGGGHGRHLRVEVSASEVAPGGCPRLHLLELGEEAFLRLRAEQGIFVEFQAFLGHLVSLLQRCQEGGAGAGAGAPGRPEMPSCPCAGPSLTATFEPAPGEGEGEGTLAVFERGEFKLMCHLALPMRRAAAREVEEVLSGRLSEARGQCRMLSTRLSRSEMALEAARTEGRRALAAARADGECAAQALAGEREARRAERDEASRTAEAEAAGLREAARRDLEAVEARGSRAREEASAESARLQAVAEALRDERDASAQREARLRQEADALRAEIDRLRQQALDAEEAGVRERDYRQDAERTMQEAVRRAGCAAAEAEKVGAEAALCAERLTGAQERARELEERAGLAAAAEQRERDARAGAEAAAAAAASRADAAEMQAATWRSKSRLRAAVCTKQEALLGEREQAVVRLTARAEAAETKVQTLARAAAVERERAEDAGVHLAEARQQLEEDARAITWLNRRLDAFEAPLAQRRGASAAPSPHRPSFGGATIFRALAATPPDAPTTGGGGRGAQAPAGGPPGQDGASTSAPKRPQAPFKLISGTPRSVRVWAPLDHPTGEEAKEQRTGELDSPSK